MQDNKSDFYIQEKEKWDKYYATLPLIEEDSITKAFGQEFVRLLQTFLIPNAQIVEAGCGDGWQSLSLARAGFNVTLLDFSTEALLHAKRNFENAGMHADIREDNIFSQGKAEYDLVFNAGVLEHYSFSEQVAFVKGMAERTRKYVLVLVPNKLCYWYWVWRINRMSSENWAFGKEVPLIDMAEVFQAANLSYHGHQFLGSNWTNAFIEGIPGIDEDVRREILTIHETVTSIPLAQRSYLIAFLGSVKDDSVDPNPQWSRNSLELETHALRESEMSSAIADAVALRINADNKITSMKREFERQSQGMLLEKEKSEASFVQKEQEMLKYQNLLERKIDEEFEYQENMIQWIVDVQSQAQNEYDLLVYQNTQLYEDYKKINNELWGVKHSKGWRISSKYWQIRQDSNFIFSIIRFLIYTIKFILRFLYRKVVPLGIRRYLWLFRNARSSLKSLNTPNNQLINSTIVDNTIQNIDSQIKEEKHQIVKGPAIICFPVINWDFRFQRPQQLISQFAVEGYSSYYLNISFTNDATITLKTISNFLWEVFVPGDPKTSIYQDNYSSDNLDRAIRAFSNFKETQQINDAICLIQHPFWEPLVIELRKAYNWRIVYDCMDDHSGFEGNTQESIAKEQELILESDLLIVTSKLLFEKYSKHRDCYLIPNGGDFDHFHNLPLPIDSPLAYLPKPVIGYYGAIAEWFDEESILLASIRHPEWSFVLIGHTFGARIDEVKKMTNVYFLGEKSYNDLPAYVSGMDICTIPFLRTPLTEATNPVKLFEYLSSGKPIVARDLPELEPYQDVVSVYHNSEEFVKALETQVEINQSDDDRSLRYNIAKANTWKSRFESMEDAIITMYEKASIIIVTYNNLNLTRLTIESILQKTTYPNYEIIIVDNNSSDEVHSYLLEISNLYKKIRVVFNDSNLGFAAANNIGIGYAQNSDYIILLNNDVIVTNNWLSRLIWHLGDPAVGLVGPVTSFAGNEARIKVPYTQLEEIENFSQKYTKFHRYVIFEIPMLAMFCVGIRTSVVKQVGLLDERFKIGMFEDDDYSERIRAAGYRVICAEDVFIHHFGRASFSKIEENRYNSIFEQNRKLFEEKWDHTWIPPIPRPEKGLKFHIHRY